MKTFLLPLLCAVCLADRPALRAAEPSQAPRDFPNQLAGKIVNARGKEVPAEELATDDYFLFFVAADSCGVSKTFHKDVIGFYKATKDKKTKVAVVLIGRDFDRKSHDHYVKESHFPFYTSFWKDMSPAPTNGLTIGFWSANTPGLYLVKSDGSSVISQRDPQTGDMADTKATLTALKTWLAKLP